MHSVNYYVLSLPVEDTFCLIEAVGGQSFVGTVYKFSRLLVAVWLEVLRNAVLLHVAYVFDWLAAIVMYCSSRVLLLLWLVTTRPRYILPDHVGRVVL